MCSEWTFSAVIYGARGHPPWSAMCTFEARSVHERYSDSVGDVALSAIVISLVFTP